MTEHHLLQVINKDGLIETVGSGEPRIDYKDDSKGALLLEPTRSNLVTSSNFQSGWSLLSGGSIAQNQSISPDGTQNAAILSGNGVGPNAAYTFINITAQEYTYSMFAKKGSEYILRMKGFSGGANGNVEFNLNNGTIETPSDGTFSNEKIEDYGNGWYRCIVKVTATSSGSKTFGFNREAIVSGNLFSVYGAQLEQGSYATSYIPTQGGAVTRNQDSCSQTVPSGVIGQTEGTLFIEVGKINNNSVTGGAKWFMEIRKDANNSFGFGSGGADASPPIRFVTQISGAYATEIEIPNFSNSKIAISYNSTNFKIFQNGFLRHTVNKNIGDYSEIEFLEGASTDLRMIMKNFKLYNTALTDQELINLTTI